MSLKLQAEIDDESFIILDSSPGTSLKSNGIMNGALDKAQIEDAMRDLSIDASASYRAHFNLADAPSLMITANNGLVSGRYFQQWMYADEPSPASMMAASTIITEDKSTEELQKRFGEILDENVILKDTLKQNNDSLKEQFLLIASCQDDMLKTTLQHREKFEETKALIEKLRQENKKLKQDMAQLADSPPSFVNGETGEVKADPVVPKSGPSSALEFVTSPDDDTVDKLTAQLELVEKQRRQVITDNEKLTWQKESLEHIVDATTKERDDLKEKLKIVELQLSTKVTEHEKVIRELNFTIEVLQKKMEVMAITPQDDEKRDAVIKQMDDKIASLLSELKNAKMEIFKAENLKMEYIDYKRTMQDMLTIQKEQIEEMHIRFKEATTTLFQPVRLSISTSTSPTDASGLSSNVKIYDRALKHLAELLNNLTHGLSDSVVETLGVILSLYEYRLGRRSEVQFRAGLAAVKEQLERQQSNALSNIGQVRGTLTIFEDIFKSYKEEVLKNSQEGSIKPNGNINALTAALVARGQELQAMQAEVSRLRVDKDDADHLKAQLELYRSDFEAEREAREKMACEKDILHTDLRQARRRCEELTQQLEEVRRINPIIHRNAISKPIQTPAVSVPASPVRATGKIQIYKCPKCMVFKTEQYKVLEDHLDYCLDDF